MRLPSIFRIPSHQRFKIQPRYYDPVKEELDQRIARIKREIQSKKNPSLTDDFETSIRGAFTSRRNVRKKSASVSFIQSLIVVILIGFFWGFYEFGNKAFYLLLLMIPVYMLIRRKIV